MPKKQDKIQYVVQIELTTTIPVPEGMGAPLADNILHARINQALARFHMPVSNIQAVIKSKTLYRAADSKSP